MHIAIITAGGAGMFCGSCMHDNTWARALIDAGHEVSLLPTYTPIRVDEDNLSDRRVLLGGVNVYLDYKWSLWGRLPRGLVRWLDAPWVLRLASRLSARNDASRLGELAVALLSGERGPQHREIEDFARFVGKSLHPDVVIFSNALLAGALHRLRERYDGPVYCTLQGDDVFLDGLPEPFRDRAVAAVTERAREFDRFIVHSRFYHEYMAEYLSLPHQKFHQIPLGIDLTGHDGTADERGAGQPLTIGYFARIAPEKGLHHLVDAFLLFHREHPECRLRVGGNLSAQDRAYFRQARQALRAGGADEAFEYVGSPVSHEEKVAFYRSVDVVSVPTEFQEPKGLYVLESLANARPVVQPAHGAFPELIEATGGGLLVPPRDPQALASAWADLLHDTDQRQTLGATGRINVREKFNTQAMAEATLRLLRGGES